MPRRALVLAATFVVCTAISLMAGLHARAVVYGLPAIAIMDAAVVFVTTITIVVCAATWLPGLAAALWTTPEARRAMRMRFSDARGLATTFTVLLAIFPGILIAGGVL